MPHSESLKPQSPLLPHPWDKRYHIARLALRIIFVGAVLLFSFIVLFPSQEFQFDFQNPQASKNTILNPRTSEGNPINNGKIPSETTFLFDTALQGNYSHTALSFTPDKGADPLKTGALTVRKSYQAFFYPEGQKASFPFGTLLKYKEQYGIVSSQAKLRPFTSLSQVTTLGYQPESFLEVSETEWRLQPLDETLSQNDTYPNGTLFVIDQTYYQLIENHLHPFVSERAYLTQYQKNQAIVKTTEFLERYPVSEDWLGFRNGSLLAFADGVFMIDHGEASPIGSAVIFEKLGLYWEDVMPASEEEIGIYKRGKIILNSAPHPSGTVFVDPKTQTYFLIGNREKHPVVGDQLLNLLLQSRHPIDASEEALTIQASCQLKKQFLGNEYTCDIPLELLNTLPGNTFEFQARFSPETDLRTITATFETAVNQNNLRYALSQIKQRILIHYGYAQ